MKFWIFALSAVALIAAKATYKMMNRPTGFTNDQVSSDWLATARIHEDEG